MRTRRIPPLVRLVALALGVYLTLCAIGGAALGASALRPPRFPIAEAETQRARGLAAGRDARLETVSTTASDGAVLRAWLFTPRAPTHASTPAPASRSTRPRHAVIILHGVGDTRAGVLGIAEWLIDAGYTVLTPDARAHGDSGGALATYGVVERHDVRQWTAWLRGQGVDGCIHGIGESMGGAQLLQSLWRDASSSVASPANLCSVVAESAFASFREVAFDRVGQRLGTGPWLGRTALRPLIELGLIVTRLRDGVNLADASPMASLRDARTPVLLIHGAADDNIPLRHARLLQEAGDPATVTLWLVSRAGHTAALAVDPAGYRARVLRFLAAHEPAYNLRTPVVLPSGG